MNIRERAIRRWKASVVRSVVGLTLVGVTPGALGAAPDVSNAQRSRDVGSPVFDDISSIIDGAIARADRTIRGVIAIPDRDRTFENTLGALDDMHQRLDTETNMAQFMAFVSTDADERAAAEAAQSRMSAWYIDLGKNELLYRAIKAYADSLPNLSGERRRLLEHSLRDYRRAGMELPSEQRERLTEIEKELSDLSIEFSRNIREDETVVTFTRDELFGVSPEFLDGLDRSGELFLVTMDSPTVTEIWRTCEDEDTREKVRFVYTRRGGMANVRLLEKIIDLRARRARMLGYETTADYQIETRMAQTAETVEEFYEELIPIVRKKAERDLAELLEAKRAFTGDDDAVFQVWDNRFYSDRVLKARYEVDQDEVRQYFPLEAVKDGLFGITQSLYGVTYRDVTDEAGTDDRPLWHEDVRLYEVTDNETGELLGEFYLDLYPRPNKYNHAAQWGLIQHKVYMDGREVTPLAALVCNFTKPTADKPSLMTHDEVETFFHEFGHCLHTMFSKTELGLFGGTNVERDFVEAPSQMFENWVWDEGVLQTFARHYQTREPIPSDLVERMVAARYQGSGLNALGQLWLGGLDLAYHSDPDGKVATTEIQMDLYDKILLYPTQDHTYFQAAFGHLMGYHAGYYGYMWSLVYASDMFQRFKELGMMSPSAGRYYREKILSRGGSVDGIEMVREYLGREPNTEAFLKHLGLEE